MQAKGSVGERPPDGKSRDLVLGRERFVLSNRRYLGAKTRILESIENEIVTILGRQPRSLCDAFAGSGVVGGRFASRGVSVIMNDLLLHNTLAHQTFLLHGGRAPEELELHFKEMESLPPLEGYISKTFGGRYFSQSNARLLDAWREYIAERVSEPYLKSALLTSVLYAADKVAQTVGHYDAFFVRHEIETPPRLKQPCVLGIGEGHQVFNGDANRLVANVKSEVLYLDPPYNSRQYSDNYHVLENIARWEKPEVFGKARKMDRSQLKSRYSGRAAGEAFRELIEAARAEVIVLSYSNTGESRVSRSNNCLSDELILEVLGSRGSVRVKELSHKEFSVGRTSKREHQERLFICEVKND